MTNAEFKTWWNRHASRSTEIRNHVAEEQEAGNTQRLHYFASLLSDVTLKDATAATDEMLALGELPMSYPDQIKLIRTIAKDRAAKREKARHGPAYVDGQRTIACRLCQDDGLVSVWSPDAMRAMRNDPDQFGAWMKAQHAREDVSFDVACSCSAGDEYTNGPETNWARNLIRYDEKRMVLSQNKSDRGIKTLAERVGVF